MSQKNGDADFGDVVGEIALEKLRSGFSFTEGPIWHPYEKWLVFSDMAGNRMHRRGPDGAFEIFREPSNKTNGNTLDRRGRLVSCEHVTSRVTRTEADGSIVVLATHYDGKQLNSPNDIVCALDGSTYFTDPPYGRVEFFGVKREQVLERFKTMMPVKFETSDEDPWVMGVAIEAGEDGLARSIEQILLPAEGPARTA